MSPCSIYELSRRVHSTWCARLDLASNSPDPSHVPPETTGPFRRKWAVFKKRRVHTEFSNAPYSQQRYGGRARLLTEPRKQLNGQLTFLESMLRVLVIQL